MRRKKSSLLNWEYVYKRPVSGLFSSLCLCLLCLCLFFLFSCGKKPNGNIQGREIRLAYDRDNFPFTEEDSENKARGFEIELMEKIAEKEGFSIKALAKNHSSLLPSVITGTSDMAIGGLVREEEEKRLQFSESYGTVDLGLLLLKKEEKGEETLLPNMEELPESFRGKTIILKEGSYAADYLEKKREDKGYILKVVQSKEDLLIGIEEGEADAVADLLPALLDLKAVIEKESDNADLKILSLQKGEALVFAVSRGQNQELLRAFNRGLRKLKESGEYEELCEKYEKLYIKNFNK